MKTAIALSILLCVSSSAHAETLKGSVEANGTTLRAAGAVLDDRPACIPAYATKNEKMKTSPYRGLRLEGIMIPLYRCKIPKKGWASCELMPRLAQQWPGGYLLTPCMICAEPVAGYPGVFTFRTIGDPYGPHGWVDWIPGTKQYRFWFDRPWWDKP